MNDFTATAIKGPGSIIKNNITNVLSEKYGELNTRHLFDGIDDADVENNISTATAAIKTSIDKGLFDKDIYFKLPNLIDGLALSYAAADKGKSKAATMAREAGYTELNTSVKENDNSPLSIENFISGTPYNTEKEPTISNTKKSITDFFDEIDGKHVLNGSTEDSFDYSMKKSSKLDPYNLYNIFKNYLSYPSDISDMAENIKNNDYFSAGFDFLRNIPGLFGNFFKGVKNASRTTWKLGSELFLKPKGYTVSAEMLEHSLQENPKDVVFYEDSKVVGKIKKDNKFLTHLDNVVKKVENKVPLTDEDKCHNFDDEDLFYSIHGCQMTIDNIKYNSDGTKDISVHLHDTYDFTEMKRVIDKGGFELSNLNFGSLANNAGTISSKLDAINPYDVDIYFTIRR